MSHAVEETMEKSQFIRIKNDGRRRKSKRDRLKTVD